MSDSHNKNRWRWLHQFASTEYFYHFATRTANWFGVAAAVLFAFGCYIGLAVAPADYQMGDSYRILFVHAPAAWLSMLVYAAMAAAAAVGLVWRIKLAEAVARSCAPLGAAFTICALATGALWGKPTWGAFWVWDARLTSELILLFLYLGVIALYTAYDDVRVANRAAGILAICGVVNLPIIHYSVQWWNTLHQAASVMKFGRPSVASEMLIPLLLMFAAYLFYFVAALLHRVRGELLARESGTRWVVQLANETATAN